MLYCSGTTGGGPCPCQMTQAKLEEKPTIRLTANTDCCTNPQCCHLLSQHIAGVAATTGMCHRIVLCDVV